MERVYNFAPGPSMLPVPALEKAAKEMLSYNNSGMSVMEMSHRSKVYMDIQKAAENLLRELMAVPENYKVLFLQGGASLQFAMVPMNLYKNGKADYMKTGQFATKAIEEGQRFIDVKVVASSEDKVFSYIPEVDRSMFTPDADYFHITTNNTIFGTRFTELPDTGNVPLVGDMSSNILSQVYDVNKFGLIYAGAQKNMGPAGLCVVIVREDLVREPMDKTPLMLQYRTHAKEDSLYNTPPSFSVYMAMNVFQWLKDQGGVAAIQKVNEAKAKILYDFLDESGLFKGTAQKKDRSIMNVTFVTGSKELDDEFVKSAAAAGFVTLAGHRSVGGMRASIYNAMPVEGIEKLVGFMKEFEAKKA
ncbi:MAG: 3-phosphoserine/phosphohydroxythreonine transaminase [Firmicutes bacterium]|nr:3-phosphoserine/phosphohydroxythreonine transaminase [Bacillota bacterium]